MSGIFLRKGWNGTVIGAFYLWHQR